MERHVTVDELVGMVFTAHEVAATAKMDSESPDAWVEANIRMDAYRNLVIQIGEKIKDDDKRAEWFKSMTDHYTALATKISFGL